MPLLLPQRSGDVCVYQQARRYGVVRCVIGLRYSPGSSGVSIENRYTAQAVCRRPVNAELGFDPRPVFPGFVLDEVARGQIFYRFLRITIIPAMLHIIYHRHQGQRTKFFHFSQNLQIDCGAHNGYRALSPRVMRLVCKGVHLIPVERLRRNRSIPLLPYMLSQRA